MLEDLDFRRVSDFAYITALFWKAHKHHIDVYLACSNLDRITKLKKKRKKNSTKSSLKRRRLN